MLDSFGENNKTAITIKDDGFFPDTMQAGAQLRNRNFECLSYRGTLQHLNLKQDPDSDVPSFDCERSEAQPEGHEQNKELIRQSRDDVVNSGNQVICMTFNNEQNVKKRVKLLSNRQSGEALKSCSRAGGGGRGEPSDLSGFNCKARDFKAMNIRWQKSAIQIILKVKLFIMKLKSLAVTIKFSLMNKQVFDAISDAASDYEFYRFHGSLKYDKPSPLALFIYKLRSALQKQLVRHLQWSTSFAKLVHILDDGQAGSWVIDPNSRFMIVWNTFFLVLLIVNLFYIPLKIVFINRTEASGQHTISLQWYQQFLLSGLIGILSCLDILLNFFTAYFDKGEMINNRQKIAQHYIKTNFLFDLVATTAFLISFQMNMSIFDSILILRYSKLKKIATQFEDLLNLRDIKLGVYNLLKLILLIIFLAHYCGCLFFFVSEVQYDGLGDDYQQSIYREGWVQVQKLSDSSAGVVYVNCLYWATITMISIGYGDIVPITVLEKIVVIFVALIGCGMFAYSVNNIGQIFADMNKRSAKFKERLSLLSQYMKKRGLSLQLQAKMRKYYEYIQQERLEDYEEVEGMLQQLIGSLKKEVLTDIYLKILTQMKLFKLNFSLEFLQKLAPRLKEKRVMPEEYIFLEGEAHDKICFILKGRAQVEVRLGKKVKSVKTLEKGEYFGQLAFITRSLNRYSVKSLNVVTFVYLQYSDFHEVLRQTPTEQEKFYQLRDSVAMYNSRAGTGIRCVVCDSYQHTVQECQLVGYHPYRARVLNSYNYVQQTNRTECSRARLRTQGPRVYLDLLKEQLIQYLFDNNLQEQLEKLIEQEKQQEEEFRRQCNPEEQGQRQDAVVRCGDRKKSQIRQGSLLYSSSKQRHSLLLTSRHQKALVQLQEAVNSSSFLHSQQLLQSISNSAQLLSLQQLQPQQQQSQGAPPQHKSYQKFQTVSNDTSNLDVVNQKSSLRVLDQQWGSRRNSGGDMVLERSESLSKKPSINDVLESGLYQLQENNACSNGGGVCIAGGGASSIHNSSFRIKRDPSSEQEADSQVRNRQLSHQSSPVMVNNDLGVGAELFAQFDLIKLDSQQPPSRQNLDSAISSSNSNQLDYVQQVSIKVNECPLSGNNNVGNGGRNSLDSSASQMKSKSSSNRIQELKKHSQLSISSNDGIKSQQGNGLHASSNEKIEGSNDKQGGSCEKLVSQVTNSDCNGSIYNKNLRGTGGAQTVVGACTAERLKCQSNQIFQFLDQIISLDVDRINEFENYFPQDNAQQVFQRYQQSLQGYKHHSNSLYQHDSLFQQDKLQELYEVAMKQQQQKRKNLQQKSIYDTSQQQSLQGDRLQSLKSKVNNKRPSGYK